MLSEFIAFSCLLTALTHSHICFAFVPTVTRSRSSGTAFALWNTTTRFSRRVLPLSAVFKESFAPLCCPTARGCTHTGAPCRGAHPLGSHQGTPRRCIRRRHVLGLVLPCPSGRAGVGGTGGTSAPQRGWGWLLCSGLRCPGCSGERGSHGNAAGLDAGWVLVLCCCWRNCSSLLRAAHRALSKTSAGALRGGMDTQTQQDGQAGTLGWARKAQIPLLCAHRAHCLQLPSPALGILRPRSLRPAERRWPEDRSPREQGALAEKRRRTGTKQG